jgi:hypothetical protein
MDKAKGIDRRKFLQTTAVGIAVANLNVFSAEALAEEPKESATKNAAWVQEKAKEHYLIQRFN